MIGILLISTPSNTYDNNLSNVPPPIESPTQTPPIYSAIPTTRFINPTSYIAHTINTIEYNDGDDDDEVIQNTSIGNDKREHPNQGYEIINTTTTNINDEVNANYRRVTYRENHDRNEDAVHK